jgi:5'-3' exonuclease
MIALIDGDICAYRSACSCEKIPTLSELAAMGKDIDDRESLIEVDTVEVALLRLEELIQNILRETSSDEYKIFLSGDNNFRYNINPDYKANRKDIRRPQHLQACNEYLVKEHGAIVTDGYEADDALGIEQTKDINCRLLLEEEPNTIICSIDKDLLQIPGQHYNFVKKEFTHVSELKGKQSLWRQMLVGDTSDNIFGIKGIGPVGASKNINVLVDEEDMYNTVYELYNNHERFEMNLKCLTIMTKEFYHERVTIET